MPCTLEPWEQEFESNRARVSEVQYLSAMVDELRELVVLLTDNNTFYPPELLKKLQKVEVDQKRHRQDDLDRLLKCGKLNKAQMRKVLDASPNEPLEPQLGFNPNKY